MAIGKITNINIAEHAGKISKKLNPYLASLGSKFEKSQISDFYAKYIDPNGGNNTFPVLAGLMLCVGIAPRFLAAARRNPDNKEATKDELKEIFFRDAQTAAVLLLLLKPLNAIIAALVTKKTGIPMTNKPFEKLFDSTVKGFSAKFKNFIQNPKEKLGIILKNFKDALNPMGGVAAKTNKEHISDYSNYSFESLPKLLERVEKEQGDKTKVFNYIVDGTIKDCSNTLNGNPKKGVASLIDEIKASVDKKGNAIEDLVEEKQNVEKTIESLKVLKEKGIGEIENVINDKESENIKTAVSKYLADENNSLLGKAKGLNGWLRTVALAFEMTYLGFGIPALNQRRLEKKYLREQKDEEDLSQAVSSGNSSTLINKNIKAHEVKLYHKFIK